MKKPTSTFAMPMTQLRRGFLFGIAVYVSSFVLYGLLSYLPEFENPLYTYIINWIVTIPLILFWCKWYFQAVIPTWKQGVFIGLMAVLVGLLVDALFFGLLISAGESTDVFGTVYSDWKFYVSLFEVLVLTIYAGYEFDAPVVKKVRSAKKSPKAAKKHLTKKKK